MTFWGVEIQPEKTYVYADEDGMCKLHLSQATLGLECKGKQRTVVKCKVGEKHEVLLCSLVPGVQESCSLDLLFDEKVTFTVAGPISVHLAGYLMPVEDSYDSEDDVDLESEEDELEFRELNEDGSDLAVKIEELKDEIAAKETTLAATNGKKRKKGDSAVKAAKAEDTVMGEGSEDELPIKAAVEEAPVKAAVEEAPVKAAVEEVPVKAAVEEITVKTAVEEITVKAAGEETTVKAAVQETTVKVAVEETPVKKQAEAGAADGVPTPTPTADTPVSEGKKKRIRKRNRKNQETPEAKANGEAAKTTTAANTPTPMEGVKKVANGLEVEKPDGKKAGKKGGGGKK